MTVKRIKTNKKSQDTKMNPRQMAKIKSEKHEQEQGTHTHTHEAKTYQRKQSTRVTWQEKESKNDINQLRTKLTKTHNRKQDQSRVPNED